MKRALLALAVGVSAGPAQAGLPEDWGQQVEQGVQSAQAVAAETGKSCQSCATSQPPAAIRTDGSALIAAFYRARVPDELSRYCGRWRYVAWADAAAHASSGVGLHYAGSTLLQVADAGQFGGQPVIYFQHGQQTPSQMDADGRVDFNGQRWDCRLTGDDLVCGRGYKFVGRVTTDRVEYYGFKREPQP